MSRPITHSYNPISGEHTDVIPDRKAVRSDWEVSDMPAERVTLRFRLELTEDELDTLTKDAMADACFPGNPREATYDDVMGMFRQIMK